MSSPFHDGPSTNGGAPRTGPLKKQPAAVRLKLTGIKKAFGATRALDGVSLEVGEAEVHALIGENGAGKSTLMKVLSGVIQPDAGVMKLEGRAYTPADTLDARRHGVAMIYQELSLAPHLNVWENIGLGIAAVGLTAVLPENEHAAHWHDSRTNISTSNAPSQTFRLPSNRLSKSPVRCFPTRVSSSWTSPRAASRKQIRANSSRSSHNSALAE